MALLERLEAHETAHNSTNTIKKTVILFIVGRLSTYKDTLF
jgi:hypothetical protein